MRASEIDGFLREKTGEGIDAWLAQFMAAVVVGADRGLYSMGDAAVTENYRVDPNIFFRSIEEYGQNPGTFDEAADPAIIKMMAEDFGLSAMQGGGTTYAFRNDGGGKIAITGADERWYFFAVDMELPSHDVIEIADAEELARIGKDMDHPLSARYILTSDIDLGGEEHPWTPIGEKFPFLGEFNGNGHTISGLYINTETNECGLFRSLSGNAVVRDLTVSGSVTGCNCIGSIAGGCYNGSITGCTSNVIVTGREVVGGIVGYTGSATITGCTNTETVSGENIIGGIVGNAREESTVTGCINKGPVSGHEFIGAIVGNSEYTVLKDNLYYQGNLYEVGYGIQGEDNSIISRIGNTDGTYSIMYYRQGKEKNIVTLTEVKTTAEEVAISGTVTDADGKEYQATHIGKNAFKNVRAANIDILFDVRKIRKDAFNQAAITELSLVVSDAERFKAEKNAFRNMKRMRAATVYIYTKDKAEYKKIAAKIKKAGGDKFKIEFRQLEER